MRRMLQQIRQWLSDSCHYHLISHFRVRGTVQAVYNVLNDPAEYPAWWGKVVKRTSRSELEHQGRIQPAALLQTKGFLPYSLQFKGLKVEDRAPFGYTVRVSGDFEGRGIWTLRQQGEWVDVGFDWNVRVEKPILRWFSWILKPLFAANHRWSMAQGARGLEFELKRREDTCESEPVVQGRDSELAMAVEETPKLTVRLTCTMAASTTT
jgi:hypothetical protein